MKVNFVFCFTCLYRCKYS